MNFSAFFNNISYTAPKVPTLYSVMSTGADAINPLVYGESSHAFVLSHLQTVEIVVNNHGEHCTSPRPDVVFMMF